eukprot:4988475-Prorocentrum_lima.AAC.1
MPGVLAYHLVPSSHPSSVKDGCEDGDTPYLPQRTPGPSLLGPASGVGGACTLGAGVAGARE